MLENATRALQKIMLEAAMGNVAAWGPALRILELTHKVMQPTKGEGSGQPFPSRFIRPNGPPRAIREPAAASPATLGDVKGSIYIAGAMSSETGPKPDPESR
jgi:hypothetical protein